MTTTEDPWLAGRVAERPLPKVLYALAIRRFTGQQIFEAEGRRAVLTWQGGRVIDAESPFAEDGMGRILVSERLIEQSKMAAALRRQAQAPEKSLLEALVDVGALDAAGAQRAAKVALAVRARAPFNLGPAATFTSTPSAPGTPLPVGSGLDPRWLIFQGLKAMGQKGGADLDRLRQELLPLADFAIKLDPAQEAALGVFGFGDDERLLLAYLIKGYWTTTDLGEACPSVPEGTLLALVYALIACELLDVKPAASVPRLRRRPKEATVNVGPGAQAALRAHVAAATGKPGTNPPGTSPPRTPGTSPPRPPGTSPPRTPGTRPGARESGADLLRQARLSEPPPMVDAIPDEAPSMPRGNAAVAAAMHPGTVPPRSPVLAAALKTPTQQPRQGMPQRSGTTIPPKVMDPRQRLDAKLAEVQRGADHYTLLEITQQATSADARAAYMAMARTFHPDRAAGLGLGERRLDFERIFARLSEANSVLGDEPRRQEYLRVLAAGGEEALRKKEAEEEAMAMRILEAEEHFRIGEMYLRRQQWLQAVEAFGNALRNNPAEAEHHAYFAYAEFMANPDKQAAIPFAKQRLALALKHNEACAPAYYFLGHVYAAQGDIPRAAGNFTRAADLRPNWSEPQRELRMLQMQEKNKKK